MRHRTGARRGESGIVPVAVIVVFASLVFAALPDAVAPRPPDEQELAARLTPPSWADGGTTRYLLGADQLGRDVLSRVIHGARISVLVAVAALAISGAAGVAIGLLAGYYRGRLDDWLMRLVDVQMSVPFVLIAIAVIAVIGPSTPNVVLVLALNGWMAYARVVRGEVLGIREREYVLASRALGAGDWRIVRGHVLPNVLNSIVVVGSLELAGILLLESSLSFLGLGIQPPAISWGLMLADGRPHLLAGAWWVAVFPGLAITLMVVSVNVLADWLREVLEHRSAR
jgi:peptide/nickel transport system permease protein